MMVLRLRVKDHGGDDSFRRFPPSGVIQCQGMLECMNCVFNGLQLHFSGHKRPIFIKESKTNRNDVISIVFDDRIERVRLVGSCCRS